MRYSMAAASMAHTYGNFTMFINNWLVSLFPKGYFKTDYVNSTIAYRDLATFNNNRKIYLKKQKPMLIIRPRIEISNYNDLPINNTYFAKRIYDVANEDIDTGNLQNFFYDKTNNRQIQFLLNALRINFDVTLSVETMMEQVNLAHYFRNRVMQDFDIKLEAGLESYISRDIMYVLAKDAGFEEVFTEEGKDKMGDFLSYVNSHSMYPVTMKYKNSSGRHEFFRYYNTHVHVAIENLSIDDLSKKEMVSDEALINFTLTCDFNTAGMYVYLSENHEVFEGLDKIEDDVISDKELIPSVTPQLVLTDAKLPHGWNLFTTPAFDIDSNERPYPLDFSVLLNTSLKEAVEYHQKNGIPLTLFMNIEVLKNNRKMDPNIGEYEIDWENLVLYVYNCSKVHEYRFILSVNTLYLNDLIADIVKFREEK